MRLSYRLVLAMALFAGFCVAAPALLSSQLPWSLSGDPPSEPPEGTPGAEEPTVISGLERLQWIQAAASRDALGVLAFLAYVDDAIVFLEEARCSDTPEEEGFSCESPLPPLSPGLHVLTIAAFERDQPYFEGPRSQALRLQVGAPANSDMRAVAPAGASSSGPSATRIAPLADGIDLAILPDHRMLVAERGGRILLFDGNRMMAQVAGTIDDVGDRPGHGVLSIAADPAFAPSGNVFIVHTAKDGIRVARYSLGRGLGSRAILREGLPQGPESPRARLRIADDGTMYLALSDAGTARNPGAGTFQGQVWHLMMDGTAAPGQALGDPVLEGSLGKPSALAWLAAAHALWVVDGAATGGGQLSSVQTDPTARGRLMLRPSGRAIPGASAIAAYQGTAFPDLDGTLVVAVDNPAGLRAVRPAGDGQLQEVPWSVPVDNGPVRSVAVREDGVVFVVTPTALFRVDPAGR